MDDDDLLVQALPECLGPDTRPAFGRLRRTFEDPKKMERFLNNWQTYRYNQTH